MVSVIVVVQGTYINWFGLLSSPGLCLLMSASSHVVRGQIDLFIIVCLCI